jgi:hypothetical protein
LAETKSNSNEIQAALEFHLMGLFDDYEKHSQKYYPLTQWPKQLIDQKEKIASRITGKLIKSLAQGQCPILSQSTSDYLVQDFSHLNGDNYPLCFEIFTNHTEVQLYLFSFFHFFFNNLFSKINNYELLIKTFFYHHKNPLLSTNSTPCYLMEIQNLSSNQKVQAALCIIQTPKAPWEN